jgi:prepilin-type N-terminal cleavage/methylation domain-containing protein
MWVHQSSGSRGSDYGPCGQTQAFTLIELLVVIAIIAVISALLMPAISQARSYANRARCMSNQQQLGVVMRAYAEDFEGFVPLMYESPFKQGAYYIVHNDGRYGGWEK